MEVVLEVVDPASPAAQWAMGQYCAERRFPSGFDPGDALVEGARRYRAPTRRLPPRCRAGRDRRVRGARPARRCHGRGEADVDRPGPPGPRPRPAAAGSARGRSPVRRAHEHRPRHERDAHRGHRPVREGRLRPGRALQRQPYAEHWFAKLLGPTGSAS